MTDDKFYHINGVTFVGIFPLGARVIAGTNPIRQEDRPGYKKFVPTPQPEPPRRPFAGKDD